MRLPYYSKITQEAPAKYLSLAGVVDLARSPSVGPKSDTAALTPFMAQGKTQSAAVEAEFHALIVDHDDDDKTAAEIRDLYDSYGVAYLAYTTSSHQQDKGGVTANRWKVILPLANPIGHEQYAPLAMGLSLHHGADPAQARAQQVFYAPNKLSPGAPYEFIDATDRPLLDASDTGNPLVVGALSAYRQEQERKERQAKQAPMKPRTVSATSAGIIGKVCQQFDIESELLRNGYRRAGKKYLSPQSSTGVPGVHIFTTDDGTERLYSHHGESDPLSNLNHGGHSLDVFDVLVTLDYAGDVSRAIPDLASKVDPEGQQQRRQEYMEQQDRPTLPDIDEMLETEPNRSGAVEVTKPPGLAGEICRYMEMTAKRPCPELYPLAALHLIALVGRDRRSTYTSKLNLMTLAICPSAAGKEAPQDKVKRFAAYHNCSGLIHSSAGSHKDIIHNQLEGDGNALYLVDEVHSFLGSMKSKQAQTYETKMEAEILTLFATELYTLRGMEKRDLGGVYSKTIDDLAKKIDKSADPEETTKLEKALEKVKQRKEWLQNGLPNPFFSLMGHSVPERLDTFVSAENITSGFLGRTLIVRGADKRAKLRRTKPSDNDVEFCECKITEGLRRVSKSGEIVAPDDEAESYLDDCVDWYEDDEQLNHHLVGAIYARAPEHLYRVSSILALDKGTITIEHARYADALVRQSIEDVKHILLKIYSDSESAEEVHVMRYACQQIHRLCKGRGMAESQVRQRVRKPKGWQQMEARDVQRNRFQELIAELEARGDIVKAGKRIISRSAL